MFWDPSWAVVRTLVRLSVEDSLEGLARVELVVPGHGRGLVTCTDVTCTDITTCTCTWHMYIYMYMYMYVVHVHVHVHVHVMCMCMYVVVWVCACACASCACTYSMWLCACRYTAHYSIATADATLSKRQNHCPSSDVV